MLVNMIFLRDSIVRFESLRSNALKALEKAEKKDTKISEDEIETLKATFFGISLEMINALNECIFAFQKTHNDYNLYVATKTLLIAAVKAARSDEGLQSIIDSLDGILPMYKEYSFRSVSMYAYRENYRQVYDVGTSCNIEGTVLQTIAKAIKTPNDRPIHILDPRPRQGQNIQHFKEVLPHAVTYATSVAENNSKEVRQHFDKVALGSFRGSTISNEAFDILFLQPPVSLSGNLDKIIVKKEKEMIQETARFLRPGGYMILLLPYFRFYKDICLILARRYTDIQVRRFHGRNFDDTGCVIVTAKKKPKTNNMDLEPKDYNILRTIHDIDKIKSIGLDDLEDLMLPYHEEEIKHFRGSILDTEEIKAIFNNSVCHTQFWKAQEVEKIADSAKNPLLPFNTGQLGLVLTSGCLDGIVDEGNGHFHVVKGRVIKVTDSERDVLTDEIELIETTSNRVEINVLLPNGTHKILA